MYNISKDEPLTVEKITRIIQNFETTEKPQLQKSYNYYNGKQNILKKKYSDPTKPCNHLVKNYTYSIVNNYLGYIVGIPVVYGSEQNIENIQNVLNYNDVNDEDATLLRNALIYGVSWERLYLDEQAEVRFKAIDSREIIPIYDTTLNEDLLYAIRYYMEPTWTDNEADKKWIIEVCDARQITTYRSDYTFSTMNVLKAEPHYFNDVPYTEFRLNNEKETVNKIQCLTICRLARNCILMVRN